MPLRQNCPHGRPGYPGAPVPAPWWANKKYGELTGRLVGVQHEPFVGAAYALDLQNKQVRLVLGVSHANGEKGPLIVRFTPMDKAGAVTKDRNLHLTATWLPAADPGAPGLRPLVVIDSNIRYGYDNTVMVVLPHLGPKDGCMITLSPMK